MPENVDEALKGLRVVLFGLMGGLVAFALIALVVGPLTKTPDPALTLPLFGVVGLLAVGGVAGYFAIRGQVLQALRQRAGSLRTLSDPTEQVLGDYRRLTIVRAGLTEGPAFFALIAYLLTGNPIALVLAAVALALLFSQLPSREKVRALVDAALSSD